MMTLLDHGRRARPGPRSRGRAFSIIYTSRWLNAIRGTTIAERMTLIITFRRHLAENLLIYLPTDIRDEPLIAKN
jgi:hypothetical protein